MSAVRACSTARTAFDGLIGSITTETDRRSGPSSTGARKSGPDVDPRPLRDPVGGVPVRVGADPAPLDLECHRPRRTAHEQGGHGRSSTGAGARLVGAGGSVWPIDRSTALRAAGVEWALGRCTSASADQPAEVGQLPQERGHAIRPAGPRRRRRARRTCTDEEHGMAGGVGAALAEQPRVRASGPAECSGDGRGPQIGVDRPPVVGQGQGEPLDPVHRRSLAGQRGEHRDHPADPPLLLVGRRAGRSCGPRAPAPP